MRGVIFKYIAPRQFIASQKNRRNTIHYVYSDSATYCY